MVTNTPRNMSRSTRTTITTTMAMRAPIESVESAFGDDEIGTVEMERANKSKCHYLVHTHAS